MSAFYPTDFDAFQMTDAEPDFVEIDARDYAVWGFKTAARDLLQSGFSEADLARLIEESLPFAEEIPEFTLTIELPPF